MTRFQRRAQRYQPHQQQQQRGTLVHKTVVLHNPDFYAKKRELSMEVKALREEANKTRGQERQRMRAEINEKVASWNTEFRKMEGTIDLHGMSASAALVYVNKMVEEKENRGCFQIITGKGNHSIDGIARIKKCLIAEFDGKPRCSIKEPKENTGRLILHMW